MVIGDAGPLPPAAQSTDGPSEDGARLPRGMKVGPFRYTVSSDPADVAEARLASNDGRSAEANHLRHRITIDATLPAGFVRDSMLHEALHAAWMFGQLPHGKLNITDEEVVSRLTPILLMVIRDNPDLVAFLTE